MSRLFTAWGAKDSDRPHILVPGQGPPRFFNGEMQPDCEVLFWRIEAENWGEAMAIYHRCQGWAPYRASSYPKNMELPISRGAAAKADAATTPVRDVSTSVEIGAKREQTQGQLIKDIVLIGPRYAGKSTLGKLLAERLGIRQASLDACFWKYYEEAGGDIETLESIIKLDGPMARHKYLRRFCITALERHLKENRNCVIDLGAGHSVFWSKSSFTQVQLALASYPNVVLLLPSADLDESSSILRERAKDIPVFHDEYNFDMNEHFLRHHSNFDLAKIIVYTKGKSPEQSRDEILNSMI